jgi:hypothetical protein
MMALRSLIFETAASTRGVGALLETLKWGEPAYVTVETGSGTMVRIDWKKKQPDHCAIYFHCQTKLVSAFRTLFPQDFEFEGNRALLIPLDKPLRKSAISYCVAAALTYHLQSKRRR